MSDKGQYTKLIIQLQFFAEKTDFPRVILSSLFFPEISDPAFRQ